MTVGSDGKVTATSFVGDGSGLTGISSVGSLTDLGLTATTIELNYVEGATSNIQNQIDSKISITEEQASAIEANTAKVGYTDALVSANTDVVANTAKVGITTDQASAIETNTSKVGLTSTQATLLDGITATSTEINYLDEVTSNVQSQLNDLLITGSASTINTEVLDASRTLISDSDGNVAVSDITKTELEYLDGVTSVSYTHLRAHET